MNLSIVFFPVRPSLDRGNAVKAVNRRLANVPPNVTIKELE